MQHCTDEWKGLKKYGEHGLAAIIKEFTQLDQGAIPEHNKPVVIPIDPSTLSYDDKKKALDAVNLISEKCDGTIKGRTCANGSKQRMYLAQADTVASPTVSVEGLLTTLVIAAYQGRQIISFDIPGAFLQAELPDDKLLLLRLNGEFVDIMCLVNPEHKKNVIVDKFGKKILYMRVIQALYGCIEAALQWYKMFTTVLMKDGFKLNPYDKCIPNKTIQGHQCTIAWHVDDCLASHRDQKVLDTLSQRTITSFGDMKIHTGNEHDFLGMKIRIRLDKKLEIDMINCYKNLRLKVILLLMISMHSLFYLR